MLLVIPRTLYIEVCYIGVHCNNVYNVFWL